MMLWWIGGLPGGRERPRALLAQAADGRGNEMTVYVASKDEQSFSSNDPSTGPSSTTARGALSSRSRDRHQRCAGADPVQRQSHDAWRGAGIDDVIYWQEYRDGGRTPQSVINGVSTSAQPAFTHPLVEADLFTLRDRLTHGRQVLDTTFHTASDTTKIPTAALDAVLGYLESTLGWNLADLSQLKFSSPVTAHLPPTKAFSPDWL